MRGQLSSQPGFVSLINGETLIAVDHPIRPIKRMCSASNGSNGSGLQYYNFEGRFGDTAAGSWDKIIELEP